MKISIVYLLSIMFAFCNSECQITERKYSISDIEIFQRTSIWKHVCNLNSDDTTLVARSLLSISRTEVNITEPTYGSTILHWAVNARKYNVVKQLLQKGADPNAKSKYGLSPFMSACSIPTTSVFAKTMLEFGANVNGLANPKQPAEWRSYDSPISAAIASARLETVKLLVAKGADVNAIGPDSIAPILRSHDIFIISYLLFSAKANCEVTRKQFDGKIDLGNVLRTLTYEIGSKEHTLKMKVVAHLRSHGIDYYSRRIPPHIAGRYSKEYLLKY